MTKLDIDINSIPHYENFADIPDEYVGPSYIVNEFTVFFTKHGMLHREDGPAGIYFFPIEIVGNNPFDPPLEIIQFVYYQNDKKHRLDGPAIIKGKYSAFYIEGKVVFEKNYWNHPLVIEHRLNKIIKL